MCSPGITLLDRPSGVAPTTFYGEISGEQALSLKPWAEPALPLQDLEQDQLPLKALDLSGTEQE